MGSSYSSYGPGSFAGCDEMTQGLCGVALGLQRGESVEEISGSLVKGGCKHCIPGCRIATAAAEGDVGGVAVGVISEASKLLGLKIQAAIIVYGVIINATAKKCERVRAEQTEEKYKDDLSLENYDPNATKGMGRAIKAKGDFNDEFKKQEWSKNPAQIDKCMATPTNQQPTQMVG